MLPQGFRAEIERDFTPPHANGKSRSDLDDDAVVPHLAHDADNAVLCCDDLVAGPQPANPQVMPEAAKFADKIPQDQPNAAQEQKEDEYDIDGQKELTRMVKIRRDEKGQADKSAQHRKQLYRRRTEFS